MHLNFSEIITVTEFNVFNRRNKLANPAYTWLQE